MGLHSDEELLRGFPLPKDKNTVWPHTEPSGVFFHHKDGAAAEFVREYLNFDNNNVTL
jgi:hypothetical protein